MEGEHPARCLVHSRCSVNGALIIINDNLCGSPPRYGGPPSSHEAQSPRGPAAPAGHEHMYVQEGQAICMTTPGTVGGGGRGALWQKPGSGRKGYQSGSPRPCCCNNPRSSKTLNKRSSLAPCVYVCVHGRPSRGPVSPALCDSVHRAGTSQGCRFL